jgi:Yip1 domain
VSTSEAAVSPAALQPGLSPWSRFAAVFVRPGSAWGGLEHKPQWWWPMLAVLAFSLGSVAVLHDRALMPMLISQWEQQVDEGQLPPEQLERMESFFAGGAGRIFNMSTQAIAIPIILIITAVLVSFTCGFLLGHKLPFRLALEVACWSALIGIPSVILTSVVAWQKETMEGVHLGFGVLLSGVEPNRMTTALAGALDALGPLALWQVAVTILGASALSGAPVKKTAWAIGAVYLVVILVITALGAVFGRAG